MYQIIFEDFPSEVKDVKKFSCFVSFWNSVVHVLNSGTM